MTVLTKTKQVLEREYCTNHSAVFATPREDNEADYYWGSTVAIRLSVWEDMGKPDQVTVTIVPGDTLNG